MPDTAKESVGALYQELYQQLSKAYWVASTLEGKDQIHGTIDVLYDVITKINQTDFSNRTRAFQELSTEISKLNEQLEKLKGKLDQIIHAVGVVSQVTNAIDQAVKQAAALLV